MDYQKANRLLVSFNDLYKAVLGLLAYYIPFPSFLIAAVHRLRGVRIKNIWSVYISYHVIIESNHPEEVEIEEDAWLTRDVKIIAHFNPTPLLREAYGGKIVKKVKIGKGAYIGVGAMILPGVEIGEGALIGAGAVVTKSVPDFTMAAGNPARLIKTVKRPKGPAPDRGKP
jgi:acetyltransferase-like isoleucine patch superfamily enzyme